MILTSSSLSGTSAKKFEIFQRAHFQKTTFLIFFMFYRFLIFLSNIFYSLKNHSFSAKWRRSSNFILFDAVFHKLHIRFLTFEIRPFSSVVRPKKFKFFDGFLCTGGFSRGPQVHVLKVQLFCRPKRKIWSGGNLGDF